MNLSDVIKSPIDNNRYNLCLLDVKSQALTDRRLKVRNKKKSVLVVCQFNFILKLNKESVVRVKGSI